MSGWPFELRLDVAAVCRADDALGYGVMRLAEGSIMLEELARVMRACDAGGQDVAQWREILLERGVLVAANALADALYPVLHGVRISE